MNLFSLKNKTALISGAGSGLGNRFALALSEYGAKVIVTGRSLQKLDKVVSQIKNMGGQAISIKLDINDEKSVVEAIKKLEDIGEKIDILVNNAAISKSTPIFSDEHDKFDEVIHTNINGAWHLTKAVAKHMKKNKIEGSIINIASINGSSLPHKEVTAYAISKAAIIHMTKTLTDELGKYNIRINTINPGPVQSHLYGASFEHDKSFWDSKIPLGFIAKPEDLDGALIYLASNKASRYVTGSCLTIDGGISKE